ncbi:MAG: hypothetical protein EOP19_14680 [Hyphomicrobiales bacterium]|nr:MAG: hypothetical protein EOP19_14680 [Hyphomicrobiales bacterium]
MRQTYLLARDHLEQAAAILKGPDNHTTELRSIVQRTIALMMEYERAASRPGGNIVDFSDYWVHKQMN